MEGRQATAPVYPSMLFMRVGAPTFSSAGVFQTEHVSKGGLIFKNEA